MKKVTYSEILEAIAEQDFEMLKEGITEIARDENFTGSFSDAHQLADYCADSEAALEFLLA